MQPLTFAALTGRKVITALFAAQGSDEVLSTAIEHIRVAVENDVLVVAPATADLLAKFANGLADDFLTTMYLAFTGPVLLAPAMNANMWRHPATRENLETLRKRGHHIVEPEEGYLACGMVGPGRLADPQTIAAAVDALLNRRQDLEGETVLVTAGPTQEPLDPVRYISNRSSGKMGYALAQAAAARGAKVILISGPGEPARAQRRHPDPRANRRRDAGSGPEEPGAGHHHRESRRRGRLSRRARPAAEDQEDRRPDLTRTRSHAGHPGRTRSEEGRPPADRFRRRNGKPAASRHAASSKPRIATWWWATWLGRKAGFETDFNEVILAMRTGEHVTLPRASKREIAERIFDEALKLRLALHAVR